MSEALKEVLTAGGYVTEQHPNEQGGLDTYLWLVANPASMQEHAQDPAIPVRYQLPKGHVEPGEVPLETAVREVREELGFFTVVRALGSIIRRPAWEYSDRAEAARGATMGATPTAREQVRKTIFMYVMERLPGPRLPRIDEDAVAVRVDDALLPQMHYPEEAAAVATQFGLCYNSPPRRRADN